MDIVYIQPNTNAYSDSETGLNQAEGKSCIRTPLKLILKTTRESQTQNQMKLIKAALN